MNAVLIGMPGSGKTSVGQRLATRLGVPFLDTDAMAEDEDGRTIPAIFADDGESFFRDLETRMARRAAEADSAVIATGGGMILRPENMEALKKTGTVFFLDRPPRDICRVEHGGRPLLAGGNQRVYALYRQRVGLYRTYADYIIPNRTTPARAAKSILTYLEGKV